MTRPTAKQLDALIEDLTTDAHGEDEQLSGFLVGADDALVPRAGVDRRWQGRR